MSDRSNVVPLYSPLGSLARAHRLPAGFQQWSPTAQLKALLDLPRPDLTIRALRPDELHRMIKGIGVEDASDLMAYATPEQQVAYVDLEAWNGGDFIPARFDQVLEMTRSISQDHATRWLQRVDPELLALHLLKSCTISLARDVEENEVPDTSFVSPDGWFLIAAKEPERLREARSLLDLLYAAGLDFAHRVLLGALYDTPASLEDQTFHFRDARLQDLGFPADVERYDIFEPFDVKELRSRSARLERLSHAPVAEVPLALVLSGQDEGLFLWQVLDHLAAASQDDAIRLWMADGLNLVNRVLATHTSDYSDDAAWGRAAGHALCVMSLGLEVVTDGREDVAIRRLPDLHPMELYRAGVETLRPLHLRTRRVVSGVGNAGRLRLFGPRIDEVLRALLDFPPRFFTGLQDPATAERRDFRALAEVDAARRTLVQAEVVLRFARDRLGFDPRAQARSSGEVEATFANVLATLWARHRLTGEAVLRPLDPAELSAVRVTLFFHGRLPDASGDVRSLLAKTDLSEAEAALLGEFIVDAIKAVESSLGGLDPAAPIDTRFVGDALLVTNRRPPLE